MIASKRPVSAAHRAACGNSIGARNIELLDIGEMRPLPQSSRAPAASASVID
jgi:hypothetical protein